MIQNQKNGNDSTNIQAEKIVINNGITYSEAKEIAMDVFNSNFLRLSEEAFNVAVERSSQITEKFLMELEKQNPEGLNSAKDPDFQYTLFNLQKEFARSGDNNLGDLLVDLLVDRSKQTERSIIQIVLNESISVAPKLTIEQLVALSVCFLIKYTINHKVNNIKTFIEYINTYYQPFADDLVKNTSCYQHLEYTGCGTVGIGGANFIDIIKSNYKGIFSKGFTKEDIIMNGLNYDKVSTLLTTCLRDSNKYQINAINESVLKEKLKEYNIEDGIENPLITFENNYMMSNEEIEDFLISSCPFMSVLLEVWSNSMINNLTLTSVGVAIGHANTKKYIGEFTDLSTWIN